MKVRAKTASGPVLSMGHIVASNRFLAGNHAYSGHYIASFYSLMKPSGPLRKFREKKSAFYIRTQAEVQGKLGIPPNCHPPGAKIFTGTESGPLKLTPNIARQGHEYFAAHSYK
jgi:hypothetical protein